MSFRTPPSSPSLLWTRYSVVPLVFTLTLAAGLLLAPGSLLAQAPAASVSAAPAGQAGPVILKGTIADPDDELIPGAVITLTPSSGKPTVVNSGSDGTYSVRSLAPGTYSLTVTMPGFATFVRQGVKITATPQTLNAKLAIQNEQQVVNVTTSGNTVSVDQDSNASATVLKGADLDALSDDPDELASELAALAGPAAGPNGGQIYIDGFTGGQLPPKSSIREIRINQNPFSAQYDRAGFGRVEVFTKPGTDKFHGNANLQGQDKSFNSGSPFIPASTFQPDYHTVLGQGSLTGPINKKASFTLSGSLRKIQDNNVVNPPSIYATSQSSGVICYPLTAGCAAYPGYVSVQFAPQTRWDISPRVDLALGEKNTLTSRFQYTHNDGQNQGIGGNDIYSTGENSSSTEATVQISDTQIISTRVINETRFEYQRPTTTATPFSTTPSINVQGAFVGGGDSSGFSADTQDHIEVQNYTSIALTKHFLRLGGRLRTTSETNTTNAGANGTFTYNSIQNYAVGTASQYSVTKINVPTIAARSTDLGLYAEDDWKIRPNLTFSYGLRFETQNYIHDHADFAPRLSAAYGLSKKTVLRAGAGLFYDRFMLTNEFSVYRNNGTNQVQTILSSTPTTPIAAACGPATPAGCAASAGRVTTEAISGNLRAPYSLQINFGVDEQLFKGATLSVNYQHIRGVHQFNSDVANYSTLAASTTAPIQYQYQSEGVFNQNQLVANVNYRYGRATFFGYYVLNYAKSDTSGASSFGTNPYNLGQDYGRASFDQRNRLFLGGNITLPYLISLSPLVNAVSGSPYNITSGTDVNGDTIFNDRAVAVPVGTVSDVPGGFVKTIRCGTFATPGTLGYNTPVPINACTGPASFTTNLRVTKTFGFGVKASANARRDAQAQNGGGQRPPGGGGAPGGGGGGGGRGGGGGGFGGGGGGGGGASSGKKYNFVLGAQINNLFNIVDRSTPVGTLSSPSFGTSTQLAGNIFTSNSAIRRIYLQAAFNF